VSPEPAETPLIALVYSANRELQLDMVRAARREGYWDAKPSHNAVFGNLGLEGARSAWLAERAGITRQSMGEVVRELVDFGVVQMSPDPADRRAKLVTYTEAGLEQVTRGRAHIRSFDRRVRDELGDEAYASLREGLETIARLLREDAAADAATDDSER
jgi:DNA-binding MarR family transcriptional regulator